MNKGIAEIIHQRKEEQWWELYLATLPINEKSYKDWRMEMEKGQPSNMENVSLTKKEVETAKTKAENILSNFNPYK